MAFSRHICISLLLAVISLSASCAEGVTAVLDSLSKISTRGLYESGEKAFTAGDYDRALNIYATMCQRGHDNPVEEERRIFASGFDRYGNLLFKRGAYSSAMDYYLKARKIAERGGMDDLLARVYVNIGNVYAANNDMEGATRFFSMAFPLRDRMNDDNLRAMLVKNLVAASYLRGKVDSARYYSRLYEALDLDDMRFRYDVLLNRAMLADAGQRPDSALVYSREATDYARDKRLPILCVTAGYACMAQFFEKSGQADSALYYFHTVEKISRDSGYNHLLIESLRDLSRLYQQRGLRDKSLEYKSEYLALADSIRVMEEFNKLNNSSMLYDLDNSATTIRGLNAEKATQRQWLIVLGGAAVVFVVLIIILYRQKRTLRNAWADLYERNRSRLDEERAYRRRIQELEQELEMAAPVTGEADAVTSTSDSAAMRKTVISRERQEQIARDILRVMEETDDFCSTEFSLDRLAADIGSNARYVSEVINDVLGKNFRAMLNEYRVKKAMLRLSDTKNYGHLTIKAISESVGYKSQATFITVFTKFTGLKPSLYQKLAMERESTTSGSESETV